MCGCVPVFFDDEVLLDLLNFVTHPEGRDRGTSFNYVSKLVAALLNVFENGGEIKIGGAIFKRSDTINRLSVVLQKLELTFASNKFFEKAPSLIASASYYRGRITT